MVDKTDSSSAPAESLDADAALFDQLLSSDAREPKRPKGVAAATTEVPDEGASDEADEGEVETPENPDGEEPEGDEGDADEGDDEDENEPEEGQEEGQLYTVKVDGKEEKVPLKDLLEGYSRTSDYTRKTSALAEERKSFAIEQEAVKAERQQYAALIPVLKQKLEEALPRPPDAQLRATDPVDYLLQMDRYNEQMALIQAAEAERHRLEETQRTEQTKRFQEAAKEGAKKLPELVPEWKDPKVFERDRAALRTYLKTTGFSDDEIGSVYDPRTIALANKARKFDELMARTPPRPDTTLERRVRPTAPPPPAPGRERQFREASKRLAQTGSIDDAARAFGLLLR